MAFVIVTVKEVLPFHCDSAGGVAFVIVAVKEVWPLLM